MAAGGRGKGGGLAEEELETAERGSLGGMEQTESADAMDAAQGHVLEIAAKKLAGGQRHELALAVSTIAVGEGDGAVVAGGDGLVGQSGAVHVASEVVENDVGASDGLREHDPALVPRNLWQAQAGHGGASVREEASSEELRQGVDRHEEGLAPLGRRPPRAAIGRDPAGGDEQVDVRMPLERAGPGVEHGEGADAPAEPVRISAQRCERIEGGAEERAEEGSLVLAHGAAKLGWEREDDVEVRHRQEQGSLALEPATGGVLTALRAGAMMARVVEQMLPSTCGALGEMAAECTGATARDRLQGAEVSVRHGGAVLREVILPVPANDVG
jgi:hypothetical protein